MLMFIAGFLTGAIVFPIITVIACLLIFGPVAPMR